MDTKAIVEKLNVMIPNPKTELNFSTPFELLVATILAAQCTDKRVNEVTAVMFKTHNKPEHFAAMQQKELEVMIHSCGFYRNKAKNIIAMSNDVLEKFKGELPRNLEQLTTLAGVGRKTANVVIGAAFGGDAFAVDTHVFRVTNRLGVKSKTPEECEQILMGIFDKKDWSRLHLQLVLHGRYTCKAASPQCEKCLLQEECEFFSKNSK